MSEVVGSTSSSKRFALTDDIPYRQNPRRNDPIAPNTARIHEGDVGVIVRAHRICQQIAEVCFCAPNMRRKTVKGNRSASDAIVRVGCDALVYVGDYGEHTRVFNSKFSLLYAVD